MSKWKKLAEIRFYSVTETAIIVGVSLEKVYGWIEAGLLRAYLWWTRFVKGEKRRIRVGMAGPKNRTSPRESTEQHVGSGTVIRVAPVMRTKKDD